MPQTEQGRKLFYRIADTDTQNILFLWKRDFVPNTKRISAKYRFQRGEMGKCSDGKLIDDRNRNLNQKDLTKKLFPSLSAIIPKL